MTLLGKLCAGALSLAALSFAASPAIEVSGNYVESRTADVYVGACFSNSEVQLVGNLAVFGWQINKGSWKGVTLDGLNVAAAVHANSTLGDRTGEPYPVKGYLIVDQKANLEQRQALKEFAQRMSGDLLQDVVAMQALPITFTVEGGNIHNKRVTLSAGTLAAIRTRALVDADSTCGHEAVVYDPLSKTEHAMPAFTMESRFSGNPTKDLRANWTSIDKRSAFVGTFHIAE
jgi:hypothetical protein